jgi:TolA-binding protein
VIGDPAPPGVNPLPAPRPSPRPSLRTAVALMAAGDGGRAVAELQSLARVRPGALGTPADVHYWLGLAFILAYDWSQAATELRAYIGEQPSGSRAGWAYLHLGRVYEQIGRDDEASLAYRGCMGADGAERTARRLAFERMSRVAGARPMGFGQAPTRPAGNRPPRNTGEAP